MPRLSAWFIRASLIYLLVGFTWGALLLINNATGFSTAVTALLPSHVEFLFVGWFLQLAMGTAYWILPRYPHGEPRGKEKPGWAVFILLNAGLILVAGSSLFHHPLPVQAGHLLEIAAAALYVSLIWRRVKAFAA